MIETDKLREHSKMVGGGKSLNNIEEQRARIEKKIMEQIAIAQANGDTARVQNLRARLNRTNEIARRYSNNISRLGEAQSTARAAVAKANRTGSAEDRAKADKAVRKAKSVSYAQSTYRNNTNVRYDQNWVNNTAIGGRGNFRDNTNSSRARSVALANNDFGRTGTSLRYDNSQTTMMGGGRRDASAKSRLRYKGMYAKGNRWYPTFANSGIRRGLVPLQKGMQIRRKASTKPKGVNKRRRSK